MPCAASAYQPGQASSGALKKERGRWSRKEGDRVGERGGERDRDRKRVQAKALRWHHANGQPTQPAPPVLGRKISELKVLLLLHDAKRRGGTVFFSGHGARIGGRPSADFPVASETLPWCHPYSVEHPPTQQKTSTMQQQLGLSCCRTKLLCMRCTARKGNESAAALSIRTQRLYTLYEQKKTERVERCRTLHAASGGI